MIAESLLTTMGVSAEHAAIYAPPLEAACSEFHIDAPAAVGAFLAQIVHESAHFTVLEESLSYSAQRLCAVWPKRFYLTPNGIPDSAASLGRAWAATYARNPQLLANFVYAKRNGNGDAASGDGWRYRGRGLAQLTGRDNYAKCEDSLKLPLVTIPDQLLQPLPAARSAAWFWSWNSMGKILQAGGIDAVSAKWNGGSVGLEERRTLAFTACKYLGV